MIFWRTHGAFAPRSPPAQIPANLATHFPSPSPVPAEVAAAIPTSIPTAIAARTVLTHLLEVLFALQKQGFAHQAQFEGRQG